MNIVVDKGNVTILDFNNQYGRIEELIPREEFSTKYNIGLSGIDTASYEPDRGILHIEFQGKVTAYDSKDKHAFFQGCFNSLSTIKNDFEVKLLESQLPSTFHEVVNKQIIITPENEAKLAQDTLNKESRQYLASTDWYVVRNQETGEVIPQDILDARATARVSIVSEV